MNAPITWSPGVSLDDIEKQVIIAALQFYKGNKTQTASALGIAIRTLDTRLEKYESDRKTGEDRTLSDKRSREDFLRRQRGDYRNDTEGGGAFAPIDGATGSDANSLASEKRNAQTHAGFRVEPTFESGKKPSVSMPERKEVQGVLPAKAPQGGSNRGR